MLNPEKIEKKIPAFAETLEERTYSRFMERSVLQKTTEMMRGLGNDNTLKPADYGLINTPALVLLGDQDKMVKLEETVSVYKALPNALMGVLPVTPHPIEQVDINLLVFMIKEFLNK